VRFEADVAQTCRKALLRKENEMVLKKSVVFVMKGKSRSCELFNPAP